MLKELTATLGGVFIMCYINGLLLMGPCVGRAEAEPVSPPWERLFFLFSFPLPPFVSPADAKEQDSAGNAAALRGEAAEQARASADTFLDTAVISLSLYLFLTFTH